MSTIIEASFLWGSHASANRVLPYWNVDIGEPIILGI